MLCRFFAAFVVAVVMGATAPAAFAQSPSPAGEPSASPGVEEVRARMPAAMELVEILRLPEFMRGNFPVIWKQIVSPLLARGEPRTKEAIDGLADTILAEMEDELPHFSRVVANIYAAHFTEEELSAITAFMRSPAGKSYLEKQGELAQYSIAVGKEFGEKVFARMRSRLDAELKQRLAP